MLGLDVSRYQRGVDWLTLRKGRRDLRFAIVRLNEWRTTVSDAPEGADPFAAEHIAGARRAGLLVGTYYFAAPTLHTAEEAAVQWCSYRALFGADAPGMLRPAVDIEDNSQDWSAWVRAFIAFTRRMVRSPRLLIYTSGSFPDAVYKTGWDRADPDIALWIAHHTGTAGQTPYLFNGRTALHQFTSTATVPGIVGTVDLDATIGTWSLADLVTT